MAEWSKAADCKFVSNSRVGSNPTLLNILYILPFNDNVILNFNNLFHKKNLKKFFQIKIFFNTPTLLLYIKYIKNLKKFLFQKKYHLNFFLNNNQIYFHKYILLLNFKRLRFFPVLKTLYNHVFNTLSLGLLLKFFVKGKFFLKSKIMYLTLISFIRKILLFAEFKQLILIIKKQPKYFLDLLTMLTTTNICHYIHPFTTAVVDEKQFKNSFIFKYITFSNTKPYHNVKTKQRGRLKRKIVKKVIQLNKILD